MVTHIHAGRPPSWHLFERIALVLLIAISLRVATALYSGLYMYGALRAINQSPMPDTVSYATSFADVQGFQLLLALLALVWWRAESWIAGTRPDRSAGSGDYAISTIQLARLKWMVAWARGLLWATVIGSLINLLNQGRIYGAASRNMIGPSVSIVVGVAGMVALRSLRQRISAALAGESVGFDDEGFYVDANGIARLLPLQVPIDLDSEVMSDPLIRIHKDLISRRRAVAVPALILGAIVLTGTLVGAEALGHGARGARSPLYSPGMSKSAQAVNVNASIVTLSCPTVKFCLAFDSAGFSSSFASGRWTQVRVSQVSSVTSVSCVSNQFCVAVAGVSVRELHDGSWSSPQSILSPSLHDVLASVSCTSRQFCIAVSEHGSSFQYSTGRWSGAKPPKPRIGLSQVSCASPAFCMAINRAGYAYLRAGNHWRQGTPVSPSWPASLTSISCPDSGYCVAVDHAGFAYAFSAGKWLAPMLVSPLSRGGLASVSCPSAGTCVAVDNSGYAYSLRSGIWSSGILVSEAPPGPGSPFNYTITGPNGMSVCSSPAMVQGRQVLSSMPCHTNTPLTEVDCPTLGTCIAGDQAGRVAMLSNGHWTTPVQLGQQFPR